MTAPTDRQRTRWITAAVALLLVGFALGWVARGDGAAAPSTAAGVPTSSSAATAGTITTVTGTTITNTTITNTAITNTAITGTDGATTTPSDPADPNCPAIRAVATIGIDELPSQAVDTLALVADGGPFPFDQDGGVFQNRERVLPRQATGYYHEYTVITPGSPDRGARRIIVGECGDRWYTDDHYDSFRLVIDA